MRLLLRMDAGSSLTADGRCWTLQSRAVHRLNARAPPRVDGWLASTSICSCHSAPSRSQPRTYGKMPGFLPVVTKLAAGWTVEKLCFQIPLGESHFYLLQNDETSFGVHPASLLMGSGMSLPISGSSPLSWM